MPYDYICLTSSYTWMILPNLSIISEDHLEIWLIRDGIIKFYIFKHNFLLGKIQNGVKSFYNCMPLGLINIRQHNSVYRGYWLRCHKCTWICTFLWWGDLICLHIHEISVYHYTCSNYTVNNSWMKYLS